MQWEKFSVDIPICKNIVNSFSEYKSPVPDEKQV